MWNMPYHAEHHLYPSIPFHALPAAHQQLKEKFAHVDSGYIQVNQAIVSTFAPKDNRPKDSFPKDSFPKDNCRKNNVS
ncbi:MAG: fatty acid desaturase, partial [Phormidesmis sp.]